MQVFDQDIFLGYILYKNNGESWKNILKEWKQNNGKSSKIPLNLELHSVW